VTGLLRDFNHIYLVMKDPFVVDQFMIEVTQAAANSVSAGSHFLTNRTC
jgi:hypothetical protein